MADKPPPRFAPEGARHKRLDWQPEGSQADRQKRTYLDKIQDLEDNISRLKEDLERTTRQRDIAQRGSDGFESKLDAANLEIKRLKAELSDFHQDRKGDVDRIDSAKAELSSINSTIKDLKAQHDSAIKALTSERDAANRKIETYKTKLAEQIYKFEAKSAELYAVLNPPKKPWLEYIKGLPLVGGCIRYFTNSDYRGSVNVIAIILAVPTLAYFVIAGFVINKDDPNKPCFRSGSSYLYCGAIRGALSPLLAGGAWLLGFGDKASDNKAENDKPASPAKTDEQLAAEARMACVLKERTRAIGRSDPQVHSLPWLPGDPLMVIQTEGVPNPPQINSIRLSNISVIRPYSGGSGVVVSGKITNLGRDAVSSLAANVFLMNTLASGDCQPLYSQALSAYTYVPPGTSKDFSIKFDVPSDTSSFSGEDAFLTDIRIAF